jgi:hypothetical protein
MTWLFALFLCQQPASAMAGQATPQPVSQPISQPLPKATSQADQIRTAMAPSIEKQLASVRVQAQTFGPLVSPAPAIDTLEGKANLAAMIVYLSNRAQ